MISDQINISTRLSEFGFESLFSSQRLFSVWYSHCQSSSFPPVCIVDCILLHTLILILVTYRRSLNTATFFCKASSFDINLIVTASMSLRSFTVFQDTPANDILHHQATSDSPLLLSPSSNSVTQTAATSLAHLVSTAEKENVHPLTGERAGPSFNNSKKRKTSVLVTKVHMPLGTKKQKESQELKPETKKRKSSSSSAPKGKKDGKGSGSARKTAKKSSRRVSPMPKVDEEAGAGKERERERITQADIDSRCYELTVQPLADVSRAYEQSPTFEEAHDPSDTEKVKFCPIKVRTLINILHQPRSPHSISSIR